MERVDHGHLTDLEIMAAGDRTLDPERQAHLSACLFCQEEVQSHATFVMRMRGHSESPASSGPDCPSLKEIALLAVGSLPEPDVQRIMLHLKTCERCAIILDATVNAADESPQESVGAGEPVREGGSPVVPLPRKPPFAWAWAAAAAIIVFAGGYLWWQARSNTPEQLLAQAYTQARPFEFRLNDAGYAEVRQSRGADKSVLDRPRALLEAETRIHDLDPNAASTLLLQGRAELLESRIDEAVTAFARANDLKPADPEILASLGLAYALRGVTQGRDDDYGRAMEFLLQSLRLQPTHPIAAFNLALVFERLGMTEQAIERWRVFLALEPTGGWANEARKHMTDLEIVRNRRADALSRMAAGPDAFRAWAQSAPQDVPAELFQDVAWRDWLSASPTDANAWAAFQALASLFEERFEDPSLREAGEAKVNSTEGIALLAKAVDRTTAGSYDDAIMWAQRALPLLTRNRPASFRARLEIAYGMQRATPKECLAAAVPLAEDLRRTAYTWMRGQALLQVGICRVRAGDIGAAQKLYADAAAHLTRFHIDVLQLRATGALAGLERDTGDLVAAWNTSAEGLRTSGKMAAPPARVQQFAFHMAETAKALNWNQTAPVFGDLFVREIVAAGNRQLEPLNRVYLAELLLSAGDQKAALQQMKLAELGFQSLPPSASVDRLILEARLKRAEMLGPGDPGIGRELTALRQTWKEPHWDVDLRLRQAVAMVAQGAGEWRQAETAFRDTIDLHQRAIASFHGAADLVATRESVEPAYKGLASIQLFQRSDATAALSTWDLYRGSPLSAAGIRHPIAEGTVSLVYVVLGGELAVWIATNNSIETRVINASLAEIENTAQRFQRECAKPAPATSALREDSRRLYDWLIEPVAAAVDSARVLAIDTDGWLSGIPFAALMDRDGRYLVERYAIAMADHGTLLREPLNRSAIHGPATIIAAPSPGGLSSSRFPALPGVLEETRDIAATLPDSKLLTGAQVTATNLISVGSYSSILHFAGHGWTNGGNGGLVLPAPDSNSEPVYLTAATLSKNDWSRCSLVVLSACMSGTGENHGPFNPASLVRVFLDRGALRVVASRWNADSIATAKLMAEFYRSLQNGSEPARALAEANRALLRDSAWAHPYYWASFAVFGQP